jgi:hypothetical protein
MWAYHPWGTYVQKNNTNKFISKENPNIVKKDQKSVYR